MNDCIDKKIYTLTLNPSLDYLVKIKNFTLNMINRTSEELFLPGGKGINVSMVLQNLGHESVALGFMAGFTGTEIERLLMGRGVRTSFIRLDDGVSRINVKVRCCDAGAQGSAKDVVCENGTETAGTAEETEINGMGPVISAAAMEALYHQLDQLVEGDYLVLAGSIPASMPKTIYADIMERLSGRGIQFVVDATGEALLKVLPYHPFLVKPNHHELGALFGVELGNDNIAKIGEYANKLREMGACNVLVSLGSKGAYLATQEGSYFYCEAPKGKVINTVGAGDSMVAGFLAGYLQAMDCLKSAEGRQAAEGVQNAGQQDAENLQTVKRQKPVVEIKKDHVYATALQWGVCAGSASAFSAELATKEEVLRLIRGI